MIRGVDVSHHQGPIDWQRVRASGVTFAVLKATEGKTYTDPRFAANLAGAQAAGLIVGAYHFARPGPAGTNADALVEAQHFLAVARPAVDFYALDLEDDTVQPPGRPLSGWVRAWLSAVATATRGTPWLYSFGAYWRAHGDADPGWRRYPFWLADYTPPPGFVAPWGAPTVWQYTNSGIVDGIAGRCDLDRYDGTLADFYRLIGAGAPPLPPPQHFPEDHMTSMPMRITTDHQGRGYGDLPIARARVVSIVLGGDEPSDGWGPYVGAPAYAIDHAGSTRVVIPESPVIDGTVDLVVWAVD